MNEPLDPLEAAELASAYLDGEAAPTEAALVEADPDLMALVEEMRAVRAGLQSAAPVAPPDAAHTEQAMAAALAAFDDTGPDESGDAPEASVTSLLDVAARRTGASPKTLRLIAAAAVVALAALAVPLLANLGGDDDDAATEAAFEAADDESAETVTDGSGGATADAEDQQAEAGADSHSPGAGSADGSGGLPIDRAVELGYRSSFGTFDDLDELEDAVRVAVAEERHPATPSSTAVAQPLAEQCIADSVEASWNEYRAIVSAGMATVDGRDVLVLVTAGDGGTAMTVIDTADCTEVETRNL